MRERKLILVTGGTGRQGGAVAKQLQKSGFAVRALTRHPESEQAETLKNYGIEVVKADLDDKESYREHIADAYGVFSVQPLSDAHREMKRGKDLAEMAKRVEVRHFVYSSVAGADAHSGIPHFESKFMIENFIKELELDYTILRPVSFFENFLMPQVKKGILKGKLVQPTKASTALQYIAVEDIGKVATHVFQHPEKYLNRTLTLASEELTAEKAAEGFSKELGYPVKYSALPWFIKRFFLGKDLNKMFDWMDEGNVLASKTETQEDLPAYTDFKTWIHMNFEERAKA